MSPWNHLRWLRNTGRLPDWSGTCLDRITSKSRQGAENWQDAAQAGCSPNTSSNKKSVESATKELVDAQWLWSRIRRHIMTRMSQIPLKNFRTQSWFLSQVTLESRQDRHQSAARKLGLSPKSHPESCRLAESCGLKPLKLNQCTWHPLKSLIPLYITLSPSHSSSCLSPSPPTYPSTDRKAQL